MAKSMNGWIGTACAVALALALPVPGLGQSRPRAEVKPSVEADGVRAGETIRVALTVTLPPALHVQSDQPSDPSFIPTALSLTPPAGFTVNALMYPTASELKQEGLPEPLVVFGHEFVAAARLTVGAGVLPGEFVIPGRLRYQACDDKVCYAPANAPFEWRVRVVAPGTPVNALDPDVFKIVSANREVAPNAGTVAEFTVAAPVTQPATPTDTMEIGRAHV